MTARALLTELRTAAEQASTGRVAITVNLPADALWPQALTVRAAADYSGLSEQAVRRHATDGSFKVLDERPLLLSRASIDRWAAE